jgi:gluconolactonase
MEGVVEFDDRFSTLLKADATLVRLASGAIWSEGPVYFHEDDSIIWSERRLDSFRIWHADHSDFGDSRMLEN